MSSFRIIVSLAIIGIATTPQKSEAQAYCALRDPVRTIHELYPEATSHRSIERRVGEDSRDDVRQVLPFDLHWNELGVHTLYVAFREKVPLGFIHVRSEKGRWGLVEIVWSIDLELRIRGMRYQRARGRTEVEAAQLQLLLFGRQLPDVASLLETTGAQPQAPAERTGTGSQDQSLAAVTIRSAMKALAVTEAVWGDDALYLRRLRDTQHVIPGTAALRPIDADLRKASKKASGILGASPIYIVLGTNDASLGVIVESTCEECGAPVLWTVSKDGIILSVVPRTAWPSESCRLTYATLEGSRRGDLEPAASPESRSAIEALSLARGVLES